MTCRFKFRAWDKDIKIMLSHEELKGKFSTVIESHNNNSGYTLMQFTGLQDCSGVDIYEGDIINIFDDGEYTDYEKGTDVIIEWNEDCFGYWYKTLDGKWVDWEMFYIQDARVTVKSNIYEEANDE